MSKRPYIIIFNPDEMRADSLAHLGNPASITPNLDTFAENDAVSFSNAFCQNPVCVPSRCSFMTGIYPHTKGHRTMSYLLHPGEDPLLKELHDNGYYVWMNDRNDLTAGQIEGWTESCADEIYYSTGKKRQPGPLKNYKKEDPRYQYSHFNGELGLDEDGLNYNTDDEAVDAAIERLKHPVDDRPVCIFLGLLLPHVPYGIENPYFSSIDREKLAKRVLPNECEGKAPIMDAIRKYQAMDGLNEKEWDEIRATYLGMCMKVDAQFGRLVNALKELAIYDDSAIFFFSDHGDFTGEYSLVEKSQNTFEDCLTRVPLLIKPPKGYQVESGINPALTELIDFYATAMEMAGVKPNHTHFGHSLIQCIADKNIENREFVCSEGGREAGEIHCDEYHSSGPNGANPNDDYYPKKMAQKDDKLHDRGIMIRDYHYKYISRSTTKDEFYDLELDPKETKNRIDEPQYQQTIREMQLKLLKWLQHTADCVPFEYDARWTKEMLWAKVSRMVSAENEKKVKDFIDTGASIGQVFGYAISLQRK